MHADLRPRVKTLLDVREGGRRVVIRVNVASIVLWIRWANVLVAVRRARVARVHHHHVAVGAKALRSEGREEREVACVEGFVSWVVRAPLFGVALGVLGLEPLAGEVRRRVVYPRREESNRYLPRGT